MRGIVYMLLILLGLSGCVTQQACSRKFPPQIITKDSIVIKDTVITVRDTFRVPSQTITIHDSIPCPQLSYHRTTESKGLSQTVDIHKGVITATCHEDSLMKVIENLKTIKIKSSYDTRTTIQKEYIEHWYNPWSLYISIAFVASLIVWIYLKISKP